MLKASELTCSTGRTKSRTGRGLYLTSDSCRGSGSDRTLVLPSPQSNQGSGCRRKRMLLAPPTKSHPSIISCTARPGSHDQSLSRFTGVLASSLVALLFLFPGAFVDRNCYSRAENSKTLRHCLYHWYGPGSNCL